MVAMLVAMIGAGCAFHASPTAGLVFQPPPGWRSSPGIMGFMQFWRSPTDDREVLFLFKSPQQLHSDDVFSKARLDSTLQDATIERREAIEICDRQPAEYIEAVGRSKRGEDDRVEIVSTNVGGTTYFAMYVRPLTSRTNEVARAALRELCAKP